jgi:hypothetical protein
MRSLKLKICGLLSQCIFMQLIDPTWHFAGDPNDRLALPAGLSEDGARGNASPPLLHPHDTKESKMADRETIITDGGDGGGMGTGVIAALVIVVLLLIAGGYLVINHGGSGSAVTVDVPKVTVNTPKS